MTVATQIIFALTLKPLGEITRAIAIAVLIPCAFILVILAGAYVLVPLDRAAKRYKRPTQFTIVDFFALTAHISIPLALVGAISTDNATERTAQEFMRAFGCVAAVLIWWGTVRAASRAGIAEPRKRSVLVALVVPISYVAAIAVGPLTAALLYQLLSPTVYVTRWMVFAEIAAIAALIGCRRAVNWVLAPPAPVVGDENPWANPQVDDA